MFTLGIIIYMRGKYWRDQYGRNDPKDVMKHRRRQESGRSSRSRQKSRSRSRNYRHAQQRCGKGIQPPNQHWLQRQNDSISKEFVNSRNPIMQLLNTGRNLFPNQMLLGQEKNQKIQYQLSFQQPGLQILQSQSQTNSINSNSQQSSGQLDNGKRVQHFEFTIGEKLAEKYEIIGLLGTGTFGRVLHVCCENEMLAVKMIRPAEKYTEPAKIESSIVGALNAADPEDKNHIVRLKFTFYHKKYLCMAFEPLACSIYYLVQNNNHEGFPIRLVQSFSRQIFESVRFIHSLGYAHTDLKPENILLCNGELRKAFHPRVSQYFLPLKDEIKLIDFGGATHENNFNDSLITTRSYRSPQVILKCCQWSQSSDIWSIGCIISELLSGKLLFPTSSNDFEHLLMITENAQQNLPLWMSQNCGSGLQQIFIGDRINEDRAQAYRVNWQKVITLRKVSQIFGRQPLLCDLVQKCLQIDPNLRISCEQALKHPFFDIKFI